MLPITSPLPDEVREEAVPFFRLHLNPQYTLARFDWLYRGNPAGPGRLWVLRGRDGELAGIAGAFPRRLRQSGCALSAWVLGDFCLAPAYRSLGPALQLQRACLAPVAAGAVDACYDFPSGPMEAIYRRLGTGLFRPLMRLVRPLRADGAVARLVGGGRAARSVTAAANLLLRPGLRIKALPDVRIAPHEQACGPEFSALAERAAPAYGVCLERSAEYMNWRYRESPVGRYRILAARRGGALVAYAVWADTGTRPTLVDLFGDPDRDVVRVLLSRLMRDLHEAGAHSMVAWLSESAVWAPLLRRLGFRLRGSQTTVLYTAPALAATAPWFLMAGDRDA